VENRVFLGSNARKNAKKPKKRFFQLFSASLAVLGPFFGISKFSSVGPESTPQNGLFRVHGQYTGEGGVDFWGRFWARNRGFGIFWGDFNHFFAKFHEFYDFWEKKKFF